MHAGNNWPLRVSSSVSLAYIFALFTASFRYTDHLIMQENILKAFPHAVVYAVPLFLYQSHSRQISGHTNNQSSFLLNGALACDRG